MHRIAAEIDESENPVNTADVLPISQTEAAAFNRDGAIAQAREDLNFLAGLAMPDIFTVYFPPIILGIWDLLKGKVSLNNIFRLLLGLPRGHAKTTVIKLFVLWLILFTDRSFILVICANADKAEAFISDVWGYLIEPNIINLFGDPRVCLETNNKAEKVFTFMGKILILKAVGQGSVRGVNVKNRRPEVIIFDDVQDKENAESAVESHKLLQWIQSTAMKLRDPRRCLFIFIGNKYRVTPDCVCILEKIQNNPMWTSIVTGAILSDGQPLWPELHSLESIMDEFANDVNMGTPEVFLAEIMNDTESNFTSLIDVSKIPLNPFEDEDWRKLCQGRFVLIDVATNKIGADDTALGLHGVYPHTTMTDGKAVVLEGLQFGSFSPLETIEAALIMCFNFGANVIGVEAVSYQASLLFWFDKVCQERGIEGIELVEISAKGKKNKRILNYLKQALAGEVFLAHAIRKYVFKEALSFKPAKTNNRDNILDMASNWQQMMEKYGYLIKMPHSLDGAEYGSAKVLEHNTSF
jgi:hypothetical protein